MPVTEANLILWQALADAATPGPWGWCPPDKGASERVFLLASCTAPGMLHEGTDHTFENCGFPVLRCYEVPEEEKDDQADLRPSPADAVFIAVAREAVPALIQEVRRLQNLLK
jgi:hypothetical protein